MCNNVTDDGGNRATTELKRVASVSCLRLAMTSPKSVAVAGYAVAAADVVNGNALPVVNHLMQQ